MDKKVSVDIQKIKKENGLQEIDWRAFLQEKNKYPEEVQTVIEAQNQDHVKLYDEDIANIDKIMEETKDMVNSEIPECVHMHYLDGSIEFHKQVDLACVASSNGRRETSLSTKLLYAQPYLYGDTSEVDINIEAQAIYNSFLTLREESEKNVRISQKGKSGEDYVSRILNQYRNKFFILENIVIPAYEEKGNTYSAQYPKGTIIELTAPIDDEYSPKPIGSRFQVEFIDDAFQLQGSWLPPESGTIAVLIEKDSFKVVK